MPENIGASTISHALSRDEAVVRDIAVALPLESKVRQGSRRAFTTGDAVAILIVDDLCRAGLSRRAAFAIVAACTPHFVRVVAEEDHLPFVVVWPDRDAPIGHAFEIYDDAGAALDAMVDRPFASVMNVHDSVREALARLLEAERAKKQEASHA